MTCWWPLQEKLNQQPKAHTRRMLVAHMGKKKVLSCSFLLFFLQQITVYSYLKKKKKEKHQQQKACPSVSIFLPLMPFEIDCVGGAKARYTALTGNGNEGIFCSCSFWKISSLDFMMRSMNWVSFVEGTWFFLRKEVVICTLGKRLCIVNKV